MVCNKCGQTLPENTHFCPRCGEPVSVIPSVTAATLSSAQQSFATPETSGLAIGSLVSGVFSFIFPAAIAAIALGHIARSNIRKSAGRLTGDGMALAGLILGYMGLAFIPVILIIAAIAIPNLLRARIAANEASVPGAIVTINAAETQFAMEHPTTGYTCTLSDLRGYIDSSLASGRKPGYVIELKGCDDETPGKPNRKYVVVASPIRSNQSGVRTFCSDQTSIVKAISDSSVGDCSENGTTLQ